MVESIFIATVLCVGAPPVELSFTEVLERVRANNANVKVARAQVEIQETEVDRAYTGWFPKLDATGSLTLNAEESTVRLPTGTVDPTTMMPILVDIPITEHFQYQIVGTLKQTLFDVRVFRAPGAAKSQRNATIARADATEDDLLFTAATQYANLSGLKAQEAAAERAIAVAEQRVADAKTQLESGTATRLVLTRAETDLVVARGQRASVRAQRRGGLANLRALIASPEEVEVNGESLTKYVKDGPGYEERASVKARALELEAAERAIGLFNLGWVPTLNVEGLIRYASTAGFADDVTAAATFNLVFPIFDGGVRYVDTDAAEARASVARHQLEQERLTAQAYLEDARANLDAKRAELEQAQAQLALANDTVKQTEELLGLGAATNLELTDADSRRFSADRAVAQKQFEFELALLRTYYASGGRLLNER